MSSRPTNIVAFTHPGETSQDFVNAWMRFHSWNPAPFSEKLALFRKGGELFNAGWRIYDIYRQSRREGAA